VIFEEATTLISGDQYVTGSMVIPMFQAIKNALESPCLNETTDGATLRSAMSKSVRFYLGKYDYLSLQCLAAISFLDPR
jgi:hypothetical protein